jgi:hypothetical protein
VRKDAKSSSGNSLAQAAEEMKELVKSYTVSLQFTGRAPQRDAPKSKPLVLTSVRGRTQSDGDMVAMIAEFKADGMRPGQDVLWRLFYNGGEQRQWRRTMNWKADAGTSETFSYDEATFHFSAGFWEIETYVDGRFSSSISLDVPD